MYLLGIDLYNLGYFWESHEAFEALWHAAGSASLEKQFFQAIIQIAASNLKFFMGAPWPGGRSRSSRMFQPNSWGSTWTRSGARWRRASPVSA